MAEGGFTWFSCPAKWAVVLACLVLGVAVNAQDTEDFDQWSNLSEQEDFDPEPTPDAKGERGDWFVRLGVLGGVAPAYLGSDNYELAYAPDIKIVWKDRVFIRGRKLGVNIFRYEQVKAGAFVRYSGGRSENNEGLEGLGDVDMTITGGAFFNYRYKILRFKSEIRHDLLGNDQGTMAIARLGSKFPFKAPMFSFNVGGTWTSGEYMDTFYGISARQSLRSGLRQYDADAGIRDVFVHLATGYKLSQHWRVTVQAQYRRLLADAADSPIVQDRGSRNSFVGGLGLSYTF